MEIIRTAAKTLKKLAKSYPVVTIVGPRQVGKTTLARNVFPDKTYVNLEAPDILEFALNDSRGFISQFPNGAILDEIQNAPKLLSYIQVIVDQAKLPGQFILTGSQQLDLGEAITQSLAGRTGIISLLPLSILELQHHQIDMNLDNYLLTGFLPDAYKKKIEPQIIYGNYTKTYLERDVRKMTKVHDLMLFQKFMRLCASRVGCLLNLESLANEVGISATTVGHWLSILEASYLIFRIAPYFENFGKRLIKASKLYFFDVGLVSYLLNIETENQMSRDPLRGHLVENLVVLELIKSRLNNGLEPNLYFFRDNHQNEVDILYKTAQNLIPIEIKSAQTFDKSFLKGLEYFRALAPDRVPKGFCIYAGLQNYNVNGFQLINFKETGNLLTSLE